MTFSAVVADGDQTKTVLGGQMGDPYRKVMWQYGDTVGVCRADWYSDQMSKFTNVEEGESETATFIGQVETASSYYAFYPLSASPRYNYDWNLITFNWPVAQTYAPASFGRDAMPMVSKANSGEVYQFNSLAGVFAVNLTGTETIKSVSFTGYDANGIPMPVAGTFSVNMGYTDPQLVAEGHNISTVTLNCKDGVNLDSSTPTPFYIVLPVATYNTFTISIATTDGKLMFKKGTNPLNIQRANVTKAGTLAFVEEVAFDLSQDGNANCYIVTEPGIYSFDATVVGNGAYGIIDGAGFHTSDARISPASAEIIWEDNPGAITNLAFDGKNISFLATNLEGNTLVGVRDNNGKIIWSWHIWSTDQPQELIYENRTGSYGMYDRNLGAIASYSENTSEIWGYVYQWGRKDPIRTDSFFVGYNGASIEEAIDSPTTVHVVDQDSHWNTDRNLNLWSPDMKTIYDPCPVGYRVPHKDVWLSLTNTEQYSSSSQNEIKISGEYMYGRGVYLYYDYSYSNTTFYVSGTSIRNGQAWGGHGNWGEMWSSESSSDNRAVHLELYYNSYYDCSLNFQSAEAMNYALHVRCMRDSGYESTKLPITKIVEVKDYTSEGATIVASVLADGSSPVTERGIIWGESSDLELGNNLGHEIVGDGLGEFSHAISGLNPATKYYARAYAVNESGTTYSNAKMFYTTYEGGEFYLSAKGAANSYIVPLINAEYSFDATVKGNSTESVGDIVSVEVLWETELDGYMNPGYSINVGDIIEKVELKDGRVYFSLPSDPKPGNALIAVKDASATYLWSWHIWVTDFDPEETKQTLPSGAVLMDRNLGALSANSMTASVGCYYQWGRKDPFINTYLQTTRGSSWTSTWMDFWTFDVNLTVQNPYTVFYGDNTTIDKNLWRTGKTMYDPCPSGWSVPDSSVWDGMSFSDNGDGHFRGTDKNGNPIYIPMSGYLRNSLSPEQWYSCGYLWSNKVESFYIESWDPSAHRISSRNASELLPVRCAKVVTDQSGEGNDYIVDDDFEW